MTDGNTGSLVAPVVASKEDDNMTNIARQWFERAANAITEASKLAQDIAAMRQEFEALKNDLEYVRHRNRELDQALADVRTQRDTAMRERDEARQDAINAHSQAQSTANDLENARQRVDSLQRELEQTKAERDEARAEATDNRRRALDAEDKLANVQSLAMDMFGLKKPEPVAPTPVEAHPEPTPVNPSRVYDNEPGFDWNKPYQWDHTVSRYWQ